jgi:hypothetical protein
MFDSFNCGRDLTASKPPKEEREAHLTGRRDAARALTVAAVTEIGEYAANVNEPDTFLLELYAIERQDDLNSVSVCAVLLSAWLALLGVIGYVLLRGDDMPSWLLAFLPVSPLPLAGLGALLLAAGSVRACLLDALERELQQRVRVHADGAPVPSYHAVSRSPRLRGLALPVFVTAVYLPLAGLYFGIGSWSIWLAWDQNRLLAMLGALCALVPICLIGRMAVHSLRHKQLWREEVAALRKEIQSRAA